MFGSSQSEEHSSVKPALDGTVSLVSSSTRNSESSPSTILFLDAIFSLTSAKYSSLSVQATEQLFKIAYVVTHYELYISKSIEFHQNWTISLSLGYLS